MFFAARKIIFTLPSAMKSILCLALLTTLFGQPASARPSVQATEIQPLIPGDSLFSFALWRRPGVQRLTLQPASNEPLKTPPTFTQVRVLWTPDDLLVRFDCVDHSIVLLPGGGPAPAQRDLPYYKADVAEVFLDPVGDSRMWMEFEISPNNGIFDSIYFLTADPQSQDNGLLSNEILARQFFTLKEWNLDGLRSETRIWPRGGWSAILDIPARSILQRLGKTQFAPGLDMRVNFVRFDYFPDNRPAVFTCWNPTLLGCAHISPSLMGDVVLQGRPK